MEVLPFPLLDDDDDDDEGRLESDPLLDDKAELFLRDDGGSSSVRSTILLFELEED
jgi:hypothetical protein